MNNIWNFATFNLYTVPEKNPISSTVFNRFSKSLPQLEDVEGGHLGRKFQVRRYLSLFQWQCENLAHRQHLKFCHFQPVHCARKKSYIFNGIPPIFEIFAPARRCWVWAFVCGSFRCAGVLLLQWQGENFARIENIWNFATFNLYTVPAKTRYLKRYSTDFRNLWLSSKVLRVGIWAESFRCARVLLLKWEG